MQAALARGLRGLDLEVPSMFKKLLLALGFAKAPAPVRSYLTVSSFVGALPALAWVLWRNRNRIRPLLQRASSRSIHAT
jgi:hypothetical protein